MAPGAFNVGTGRHTMWRRYGRVESVKVLPKRGSEGGVAAFVDFVDIKSAQKAHNAINKMGDRDLRTDYNEPGTIPSAARGLDDSLSLGSRGRDVSGFTRAAGGPVYAPPASLHSRDGRYERRLDGTGDSRERAYDHNTYGHHDRAGSGSFERQRHYDADYYRDTRERTLGTAGASGSVTPSGSGASAGSSGGSGGGGGSGGAIVSCVAGSGGAGGAAGTAAGSGGSTSSVIGFYRAHSRSPCRFESPEPRYESQSSRARESFTLASVVHRDLYREDRGRRSERTYRQSRSRSRSTHSRNPSPQRLTGPAAGPAGQAVSLAGQATGSRSRDSSSSSSDDSPARSVQSAAVPAPSALPLSSLDKDEPRKSFGIKVQNLPVRSTDTSLKDGLFHEFKKHGKVTSVQIHGASDERYGLVFFRQQEDQEKAQGASKGKLFFGMQIEVIAWNGPETESENEFRPLDERIDEFHPKATRTLFIGNLEKTTSYHDLLNIFQRFGEIVDIDIKKVNGAPQYAFLQYCDIASVCKAIKKMDGEYLGSNRLKLGFGKSMPTTCVWLDGLASNTTEQFLTRHFCRYGHVAKVVFDRMKGMALILYNNIEYAQAAVKEAKGWKIGGNKVKESQMAFYRSMQASGQDIRDFYDLLTDRRDERRTQYEFSAERTYYDNVRTSATYGEDPRRKYPSRSREFYGEWDPYQGDYYDPQYFEDLREYREYRADPYEQDIRKYSYLQRERERERERFETDRGRDHGRRTIERSQSPTHIPSHRPPSPTASPSLSERIQSDSDRRLCCRSSERSGSCSSVSPPRFEKPDKTHGERYTKSDKLDKDRPSDTERGNVSDKEKRVGRKDKTDKQMLKKLKASSPNSQEMEPRGERDVSPVAAFQSNSIKTQKEASGKVKVDILPCVVQLTRVKEKESKEGKIIGHSAPEKRRPKGEIDIGHRLASPSEEQRSPLGHAESSKVELPKLGKVEKRNLFSLVDVVDKDAKFKTKKHFKPEVGFDIISTDIDRLAARKRRFEDSVGKTNRQKRPAEKEDSRAELCLVGDGAQDLIDEKSLMFKRIHKKEHSKDSCDRVVSVYSPRDRPDSDCDRVVSVYSPRDRQDSETNSIGLTLELQSRLGSLNEYSIDSLETSYVKMECGLSKSQNSSSLTKLSDDSNIDAELEERKPGSLEIDNNTVLSKESTQCNEELFSHLMKRCKKQTESSSWLGQKLVKPHIFPISESPQFNEAYDFEKDRMLCDSIKSNQNDDNATSSKRKKLEQPDTEVFSPESEQNICSPPHVHEAGQQNITSLSASQVSNIEADHAQISLSFIKKEQRTSPIADEKIFPHIESLKYNLDLTARDAPDTDFSKLKSALLGCDKELLHRWERKIKSDSVKMEMTSPSSIVKHETIRTNLGQDLEPGEVQSDSDEYSESKHELPSTNTSLSCILREREERCADLKLSGSLEKNKFYSFALDKTITPDTKALLERAKTLYSSREENWSFLPTCFPSADSCSDKEKVELAPRPIPSWYMKKKKIRTDSEGKLCDKKDELKPQEQERQELFASRFLHSSIFEQDSLRLQRLERKDQDVQTGASKPLAKLSTTEVQPVSGSGNIPQEPKVLFHSRFMELQQQKDKDYPAHDAENVAIEIKEDLLNGNNDLHVNPSDQMHKMNTQSVNSIVLTGSPQILSPRETSPLMNESKTPAEVKEEHILDLSPPQSPLEEIKSVVTKLTETPALALSEPESQVEEKVKLSNIKLKIESGVEDKPPTPGSSLCSFDGEAESPPTETITTEPKTGEKESKQCKEPQKSETEKYVSPQPLEADIKLLPNRKQPKSKRARSTRLSQIPVREKPVTRKSERIDKEKLKRASSPREISKTSEGKNTPKSPSQVSDLEQNPDASLVHGRTRRRNVKSVYATLHEGEPAGKEVVEPLRSMRKRGSDKEQVQQDCQNQSVNTRRGRPPKRGGRQGGDDASPAKEDQPKMMEQDVDLENTSTSLEILKTPEGWCSPRTQKVQQPQVKKTSKVGRVNSVAEETDLASSELLEPKLEIDSGKVSQKEDDPKEDLDVQKSAEEEMNRVDVTPSQIKQPEKMTKIKTTRLKRNTKQLTDEKSHNLKNLEIRVSVDDVKCLLRSEENEPVSFEAITITKTIPGLEDNKESRCVSSQKETKQNSLVEMEEDLSDTEMPVDSSANLLARQMELEQAVENIAKLAADQQSQSFKEPPAERPSLPPTPVEPQNELEVEKRALPACETELAAAIDSITSEDISAEPEGFTAPPRYTDLISTSEAVTSPTTNNIIKPVKPMVFNNIPKADQAVAPKTAGTKSVTSVVKAGQPPIASPEGSKLQVPEMVQKIGKIKTKTAKKSRSRKGVAVKMNTSEEVTETQASQNKLPESIPEDHQIINSKAVTAASMAGASVVTALATCRQDISSAMTVDTPKEAEQPAVEQPVPQESAFHLGTNKASSSRKCLQAAEPPSLTIAPAPAPPMPVSQSNVPQLRHGKMSATSDWLPKSEGSKKFDSHSPHVTVVTLSEQAVAAIAGPQGKPVLPADTKASDIDPSSSTLRKILMEPKYVSALKNKAIPNTSVTSVLSEASPKLEKENPHEMVDSRQVHSEETHSLSPQPTYPKPSPLTESRQNYGEKIQPTVISSPSTSVISRIPIPYDSEDTPRISLSNRNTGLSLPKQKFRSNTNENSGYHVVDTVNDVSRGRSVVENTAYSTAASHGLRVNTSEGVVVLSYSGQKTEGPQRMRAKISQIPPPSAGDIDFQQSVSKSHVKQEPITLSSQPSTPKAPLTPTIYGHTRGLLSGPSYNSQPVIASTKQESPRPEKYDVPFPTVSQQGSVVKFQQSVASSKVLMYSQAVIQTHGHSHGKRGPTTEPARKKLDMGRPAPHTNLSPCMSPHHPSLSSTCMSPSSGIPTDRPAPLIKQEPQSPRSVVTSPSSFVKACPPSSSPIGSSSALGPGLSPLSPYHPGIHHTHTEQSSVIMPPHNVTHSMANEARLNTPPISAINYGRRSEPLPSPRPVPPHHSSTPKSSVIRDMVLQSHMGQQGVVAGGINSSVTEEDPRHFNQVLPRPSVPQVQPDVIMMQSDRRNMRLDQYRDMHQRILLHQELGEPATVDARQARPTEASTVSSVSVPAPSIHPLMGNNMTSTIKETSKLLEGKHVHLPHTESRIMGGPTSSPVMVSPQRMHPGGTSSFPVYRDMLGLTSQFPRRPSLGVNRANRGITVSLDEGKCLILSLLAHSGAWTQKAHTSATAPLWTSRMRPDCKEMPCLLLISLQWLYLRCFPTRQTLTLSRRLLQPSCQPLHSYAPNDQAAVQLHFVSGNEALAQCSLPPPEGGALLRIVQRMRLEASQLDSVARRMTSDYCLLLALPCGRDLDDVLGQTQALKTGFITYLQAKQAAGIINVPNPGSNQPAFVVQIFPPCEFSEGHLSQLAPDLLSSISSISPHLMIVIASV
ncbi:hypothetical protein CRUP_025253 [Coryphaenoides rupestris]|nr:hypothetical protein CRUP_025253 [Coryphaenoides rupestris]